MIKAQNFKRLTIKKIIFLSLGIFFSSFIIYQVYFYFNPLQRIDFSLYAPHSVDIEKPELRLYTRSTGFFFGKQIDLILFPVVTVDYTVFDGKVDISLTKNSNKFSYNCTNNNCQVIQTSTPRKYRIYKDHNYNYVKFNIDNTLIMITYNTDEKSFSKEELDKFINSFYKTEVKNLTVRRLHPGL